MINNKNETNPSTRLFMSILLKKCELRGRIGGVGRRTRSYGRQWYIRFLGLSMTHTRRIVLGVQDYSLVLRLELHGEDGKLDSITVSAPRRRVNLVRSNEPRLGGKEPST